MLRISVVGLGMAAEPHARSLMDLRDRVEVLWAASPAEARTRAFAARYPFRVTNDVQRALTEPAVDAVIILTPPNTHAELAMLAISHGKHVLVEKPLDANLERAEALVAAADAADVRLGVVFQHRFRPGALRLAELLRRGALGQVQAAGLAVPWWRPQSYYDEPGRGTLARDGGGVLMTQAIHTLDLFRSLLAPVTVDASQVWTTALHRMECEDFVSALLRVGPERAPGSLLATTGWYPGEPERIEIVGEHGSARLVGGTLDVRWLDGREERCAAAGGKDLGTGPMAFPHDDHRALIGDFCDAVSEGRVPLASGQEALATQRLIADLLQRAASTGGSAQRPRSAMMRHAAPGRESQ